LRKGFAEDLLLLGKVIRPHGLKGLLRIASYAQSAQSFLKAGSVYLKPCAGREQNFKVISVQPLGKNFLMKLEGISSLAQAEPYGGAEIRIRRESLGPGAAGEYFWADIVGLKVYTENGKYLGEIAHIFNNGSHDIYVLKQDDQERLIPAVHAAVKAIDPEHGKMIVSEREALPDSNEI
jgi:16S rRNA processing protein RimM